MPAPPQYIMLAGDPGIWQEDLRKVSSTNPPVEVEDLLPAQSGSVAELVCGLFGWYVRAGVNSAASSTLAHTAPRGGPLDGTFEAAMAWGIAWTEADRAHRVLLVRSRLLHQSVPQQHHQTKTSANLLTHIIAAAAIHGAIAEDPEQATGDLEEVLRVVFGALTHEQIGRLASHATVVDLLRAWGATSNRGHPANPSAVATELQRQWFETAIRVLEPYYRRVIASPADDESHITLRPPYILAGSAETERIGIGDIRRFAIVVADNMVDRTRPTYRLAFTDTLDGVRTTCHHLGWDPDGFRYDEYVALIIDLDSGDRLSGDE